MNSIRQKIQQAFDAAIKSGPLTHTINRVTRPVNGGEWPAFKYGDAAFYVAWIVDEPNIYSPDMGEDWETYQSCHEPRLALRCRKSRRADGKRMGSGAVRRSCEPDAVDVDKLLKAISSRRSYYFKNQHKEN